MRSSLRERLFRSISRFGPQLAIWHKGEQIEVQVSGHYIREGWFEPFCWETNDEGEHVYSFRRASTTRIFNPGDTAAVSGG